MLQIAIHGDDDVALSFVKAGRERGSLSEVAAQANHFQPLVGFHEVSQQLEAPVGRSVVHEQNLIRLLH